MASALSTLLSGVGQVLGRTVFLQPNTSSGIPIPLVIMDIVEEEIVEYEASVTEHPVEAGPEITDHIQLKNPTLRIKGKISSTPLDMSVAIANVLSGGLAAISDPQARTNLLNSGISAGIGVVGAALQGKAASVIPGAIAGAVDSISRTILISCYENKTPFTIITKRQSFENMIIQRLTLPRNKETGYSLAFEMEIKQLRIVSPIQVQKTSVAENVISSATSITSLGSQSTQEVSPQIENAVQTSDLTNYPTVTNKSPGFFGGNASVA